MRGSVTRLVKKGKYGFILGEDGVEVYFDQSSVDDISLQSLCVGEWVEYDMYFGGDRLRALNVRHLLGAPRPSP